ncbi:3'5'-cyclic nucleotide phosphodiesterase family protein [Trichomonas vaginalis G3]|uniref:3'5'-cyclic nucleotide phosphodiesterase family protein n=1 Tax=Trichomonas vaginalis (strain ATCC PRA-98 / G3) TaxID=412133 RepID=A2FZL3_TRIV3|nr:cyclic nucleotide phosphodiesterase family [Trichomonas vaginalis G3]EAX89648.1 3'5'-cyclic nucleotide phosphodiesterase family protein [Trichomonas vaginalis G3]KAI5498978.1 cyclic nucleotide phosphodiesterase family [Trichomonas vaginalis G3]|eukprot:XP_001302578.1 3'5'-cyclic nucleotide phosphodiesterase family protein [Trichomonas vaginalis G3]
MSSRLNTSHSRHKLRAQGGARDSLLNPQHPYQSMKNVPPHYTIQSSTLTKQNSEIVRYKISPEKGTPSQLSLPPLEKPQSSLSMMNQADTFSYKSTPSYKQVQTMERHQKYEQILDSFLLNSLEGPIAQVIEETIGVTLDATTVTLWQDIPSLHMLYSKRLTRTVNHSSGLVGFTFFTREIVKSEQASQHNAYVESEDSLICPGNTQVLLFPLWDSENNICAVVEVTKQPGKPFFSDEDEDFILFFTKRFKIYSQWLFKPAFPQKFISDLSSVMELEQFLLVFQQRVPSFFNARAAEIWKYDMHNKELYRYDSRCTKIDENCAGIVWEAFQRECPINCSVNKMLSSYTPAIDGDISEAILVVPLVDIKKMVKWAIILRGHKGLPVFTQEDESLLREVSMSITISLDNADRFTQAGVGKNRSSLEHQCITSLENAADSLIQGVSLNEIVSRAIKNLENLTSADKSYLFFFDEQNKKYVCDDGHTKISLDQGKGIVGLTFNNSKIYNIPDVMSSTEYDMTPEIQTGYKAHSLLSVPLINNRKEVIAVLQLLNRRDQKPFSNIDVNFVKIISNLIGLLMENEKMFGISTQANKEVEEFIKSSNSMQKNSHVKTVLSEIVHSALETLNGDRASLFIHDKVVGVLSTLIVDGGELPQTIPMSHGIAATVANTGNPILVNDAYHDPRFNKMIDFHTGYKTQSVCAAPIMTNDEGVIGVIEVINKKNSNFSEKDILLLQSFATFCGTCLESKHLKDITERGTAQIEMAKWIGEYERNTYTIPFKLQIPTNKQSQLTSLDFFAVDWNGIGLFKVCFHVFSSFGLLERFKISNELFFTFLYRLRESYNEPPYHNWIHAIDVLQYVSYQCKITNADSILTHLELLAVCVAAICHDAGHEGYNNNYNINAQTPLGILFKDRSVMETYHCTVAIQILKNEESNILYALTHNELQIIWKWIIHLILATDMANHFKLIKQAEETLEQGALNLKNESDRLMAMELIMKVADISNVSRPFKYADQWCEVLSEEFWRQGDSEKSLGLPYSGPLMNREQSTNKAKGQVNFYTFLCLPLYKVIARIFPELTVNLESMQNNLKHWEQLVAEQEAAAKLQDGEDKFAEQPVQTSQREPQRILETSLSALKLNINVK